MLQTYLIFLSTQKYLRFFANTSKLCSCKSKEVLEEIIENINSSGNSFSLTLISHYLPEVQYNGRCLVNNINTLLKTINLYISYKND